MAKPAMQRAAETFVGVIIRRERRQAARGLRNFAVAAALALGILLVVGVTIGVLAWRAAAPRPATLVAVPLPTPGGNA